MPQAFVSYSREDRDVVTQLTGDLNAIGIGTWHDEHLTGGQRWWDNILANIRYNEIFIFALSPQSWESKACKSELLYATQLGKTVLPVLVSDGINTNFLPPPLNEIQVADYRRRDKEAAFALIKSVNMAPPAAPLPDPLPKPPRVPISYLSNFKEQIDSPDPLNAQDQMALFLALKEGLQDGFSPMEIRDLLLMLKRRDDLLAKIGTKIDATLRSLESAAPGQTHHADAIKSATPPQVTPPERRAEDVSMLDTLRSCQQCQVQFDPGSMFCSTCGASLTPARRAPIHIGIEGQGAANRTKSKARRFVCPAAETPRWSPT